MAHLELWEVGQLKMAASSDGTIEVVSWHPSNWRKPTSIRPVIPMVVSQKRGDHTMDPKIL